jgi:hypothetical protein
MIKLNKSKRGQLTIFIIIGLIIVVVIALMFVLIRKPGINIQAEQNPQAFIEKCISESLTRNEEIILNGNGYINVTDNYILYSLNKPGEKVPYLCKSSQFYMPCINQEPMFVEFIRREIQNLTEKDAVICFKTLIDTMEKSRYQISQENLSLEISFEGKEIVANMDKKITATKNEQTKIYEKFKAKIQSPIYRLIDTARTIVNYEAAVCEFNNINWMKYYQDISIKKFSTGDNTKIYTLTDRDSNKKLNFAVKTCILPAGI